MAPTLESVYAKARAFVEALRRLPRSRRAAVPHGHFARDYNTLRRLALEVVDGLDERLLGKYIEVFETPSGELSRASYVEIEVYAREIPEQLSLLLQSRAGTPAPSGGDGTPVKAYRVEEVRREYRQAYAPWSATDDESLRVRFLAGATPEELAVVFGRKPSAVRSRLRRLGLDVPGAPLVSSNNRCSAEPS